MRPQVTIIIPFLNREQFLPATLDSLLEQTVQLWECVLIDDGSTDKSRDICEQYSLLDARFRYFERTDSYKQGGNGARNMGADNAKSDWLIFLDSDDLLAKDCIEQRLSVIRNEPKDIDFTVNITGTFNKKVHDNDIVWNSFNPNESKNDLIKRFITLDSPWGTEGLTWNKKYFHMINGWDESLPCFQDWNIHLRALKQAKNILLTKKIDHYYRQDVPNSIAATASREKYNAGMVKAIHCTLYHGGWNFEEAFMLKRLLLVKMLKLHPTAEHFNTYNEGRFSLQLRSCLDKSKFTIKGIYGRLIYHFIVFKKGNKCKFPLR
ncbi:glycosyltransferase family 2 protein [Colwellia sp. MB3u-4]|uniref:glycosyltransferase family 2 protein n=1 Tax=Colwellia sp. MB3u-4 TaxID=2759822 RepID=UPI0015F429CA|nr:glycosyltransferase family 2 protein [Colwellia sp. MB3u-4]MBA6290426.1 glycosyltransferase family 2 protein [Colwellia sp. MB3u-4]